jgi:hypothetical protein
MNKWSPRFSWSVFLTAVLAAGAWAQEAKPPPGEPKAEGKQDAPKPAEPPRPVVPPPPVPPQEPSWGENLIGVPIHGSLSSRLRVRWTDGEHDTDLYETLSLTIGDANRHTVTATLLARAAADLDGKTDTKGYYVFDSLENTYDHALTGQLYEATLDIHRIGPVERIRLGRQTIYETPVVATFDGGRAETEDLTSLKFRLGAYGGVPVHFYESSPEGDRVGGAFAQVQPWKGGRLRADWMHVDDENLFGEKNNDLLGLAAWQDLFDRVQVHALYTRLEEKNRDLLVRGTWRDSDADLVAQVSFYRLLETQRDFAIEFDPFYSAALEYHPYDQIRGLVSKGLGDFFAVDAGVDARWLRNSHDEGPYNHEFERYFVTPSLRDFPLKGLSISLTGEYWNSDDDVWSWGADVTQKFGDALRVSAGTAYSLYKYDYYANRERDDVRTIYLRFRFKLMKDVRVDGGYEYEHCDLDTIHAVRFGLIWEF